MERAEVEQWKAREVARLLALVETERRYYQEVASAIPVGLVILSSDGSTMFANRAFRRLSGLRSDDLGRKTLPQVLPVPALEDMIAQVVSGEGQKSLVAAYGGRTLRISAVAIRNWSDESDVEALVAVEELSGGEGAGVVPTLEASHAPLVLWIADVESGKFRFVGRLAEELLGYAPSKWLESPDFFSERIHLNDRDRLLAAYRAAGRDGLEHTIEYRAVAADGRVVWCRESFRRAPDSAGLAGALTGVGERRQIEERYAQAQRMDALVSLAARLAHDLNNPLMIVAGYGEELLGSLPASSPLRADMREILAASERMTRVTNQLLAVTRRQAQAAKPVNLSPLIASLDEKVHAASGDRVEVSAPHPEPLWVMADPAQLAAVLAAMVSAACQRARETQRVQFEVAPRDIREDVPERAVAPGAYIEVRLSDPGWAEPEQKQFEMFESFLPPKDPDSSVVELWRSYAVTREWGGHLWHSDAPPSFHLLLPRAAPPGEPMPEAERQSEAASPVPEPPPMETVLIVEDEGGIRALVRKILRRHGYQVLDAPAAEEALQAAAAHSGPIHLLLTDVLLPQMNGPELAERLRVSFPNLRVLYVSGYADDAALVESDLPPLSGFLQKPFTLGSLLGKVREVLDMTPEA